MGSAGHLPAYTAEEVVDNFQALLGQMDFHHELALLGVGRMRFSLRRKMKAEWLALIIGLWRLALERSFPHDGSAIFENFLEHRAAQLSPKKAEAFVSRVQDHVARLQERGHQDFTTAGEHLISLIGSSRVSAPALRLRLVLHIRNLYTLIFDRLI